MRPPTRASTMSPPTRLSHAASGPWSSRVGAASRRSAPARASRADSPPTALSTAGDSTPSEGASEEHTSELQSLAYLVCRLLLEKKNRHVLGRQRREHSRRARPQQPACVGERAVAPPCALDHLPGLRIDIVAQLVDGYDRRDTDAAP